MVKVDLGDDGVFYVRRFTVDEYFAAGFRENDNQAAMLGMLSIGLANEDGTPKFPLTNDKTVDPAAAVFAGSMPVSVAMRLANEIMAANDMGGQAKN